MPSTASLSFDGVNDIASTPDDSALDIVGDWTIECWAKNADASWNISDRYLMAKGIVHTSSQHAPWGMDVRFNNLVAGYRNAFQTYNVSTSVSGLALNTWHHFACTYTNSTKVLRLYVNGSLAATSSAMAAGPVANALAATIGATKTDASADAAFWLGKIDEARVWNVVRTALEISDYKDKKATGSETGLVACWHIDEGSGTTTADAAGTAQNLTISGATWDTGDFPTLTDAGGTTHTGAATVASVSTVTTDATSTHAASATIASVSTVSATATSVHAADAAIQSASSATATATINASTTATVASISSATAAATVGTSGVAHEGTATIASVSSVTAAASAGHGGTATVAATVEVVVVGRLDLNAVAQVASVSSVVAAAVAALAGMATIQSVSSAVAAGLVGGSIVPTVFFTVRPQSSTFAVRAQSTSFTVEVG